MIPTKIRFLTIKDFVRVANARVYEDRAFASSQTNSHQLILGILRGSFGLRVRGVHGIQVLKSIPTDRKFKYHLRKAYIGFEKKACTTIVCYQGKAVKYYGSETPP